MIHVLARLAHVWNTATETGDNKIKKSKVWQSVNVNNK